MSRVLEVAHQLLSEHYDCLLWGLQLLRDALAHLDQIFGLLVALRVLNKLCQVTHVNQAADLVIEQDVKNLNLYDLVLSLFISLAILLKDSVLLGGGLDKGRVLVVIVKRVVLRRHFLLVAHHDVEQTDSLHGSSTQRLGLDKLLHFGFVEVALHKVHELVLVAIAVDVLENPALERGLLLLDVFFVLLALVRIPHFLFALGGLGGDDGAAEEGVDSLVAIDASRGLALLVLGADQHIVRHRVQQLLKLHLLLLVDFAFHKKFGHCLERVVAVDLENDDVDDAKD